MSNKKTETYMVGRGKLTITTNNKEVGLTSHITVWGKIMQINRIYNKDDWRFMHLEDYSNDLLSELGEFANDIKHLHKRGSHKVQVDREQLKIELFDFYVYIVLGFESFFGDEKTFNEIAEKKLDEIKKRYGG